MNQLPGLISAIETAGSIALVEVAVDARRYTATLIGVNEEIGSWHVGMPVRLLFKETEVSLAKQLSGLISMRNRIPAVITAIERGRLLAKIGLDANGHAISAIITTGSSHLLQLAIGDEVEGLVKANEMTVMPERSA
ncbi:MAG TPA: TOBE domain-containing protein [Burkholderiaceae bacterium]|nr:TOBE domain-containing protein [Burkholderiaceae bacterium]